VSEAGLSGIERARQLSWALLARLAMLRGAAASLPGTFPAGVEAEYRRLREEFERLRLQTEAGALDQDAHERFRERARTLLRFLGDGSSDLEGAGQVGSEAEPLQRAEHGDVGGRSAAGHVSHAVAGVNHRAGHARHGAELPLDPVHGRPVADPVDLDCDATRDISLDEHPSTSSCDTAARVGAHRLDASHAVVLRLEAR